MSKKILAALVLVGCAIYWLKPYVRVALTKARGERGLEEVLARFGEPVAKRWAPFFEQAGVTYPPGSVTFIGLKEEKQLEVYAPGRDGKTVLVRSCRILAASGAAGPKLREGDKQVPEGMYGIDFLNPNSRYHLSMRIDYPNARDREIAEREGRGNLGGDIMIHGNRVSVGCLAMGDEVAEDLFVLAALVGKEKIRVILSPVDFREGTEVELPESSPEWTVALYQDIQEALRAYPKGVAPLSER